MIKLELHYGTYVWTNVEMDELRKKNCLCLNCNEIKSCPTSKQLFKICKGNDLALAVTRCPSFRTKEAER